MIDALITALEALGYPVYRQGSVSEAYPDTFITIWGGEDEHSAYDNETQIVMHEYSINVYSTTPSTAYSLLESARSALKNAGWTATSRGYDVSSGVETHIGRSFDVAYLSTEN